MKTITTIILLCFITQVVQTNGLIQLKNSLATSDSPLLMKILQLVDAASSDEHLLQVTLKLLRSLCICMRETLKAKEDYFDIGNHSLEPAKPSGNEGKVYDLYRNIYNNTCFNLRQELSNHTHKFIVDEESAFLNHTNCGKDERNETYNKRNDSDKSSVVKHSIQSRLEQVLFKALIQTKDLHEYRLRRYDLFGKGTAQTKSTLRHCLIVILTLYPHDQKLSSRKHNIDEKDLNNTLYTKSPIDVNIIDTKHDQKRKEMDESINAEKFTECNLHSLYNFLTESDRKNLIKVYKLIRKRDTIKIYIEVNIGQNHTDLINSCCENGTILPQCNKDLINNFITQPNFPDDIYINTITNIKSLLKQYETKLTDTKHHNTSATTVQDEKKEENIVIESTTKPRTHTNRIYHNENDMHVSGTKSYESSKLGDVTHAIVLLNEFVSKQNTKSYLQTHQTDKTDQPWTDFVLKEERQQEITTTCNPINISNALDVKGLEEKSQLESTNSVPLYESNKGENTQKYILENVVETTPTFKQHETSNNKEKNESQGVTLSISQEKHEVKEASTSRIAMKNVAKNTFTIDSYSTNNDVNTNDVMIGDIMQNTPIPNRVDSTVTLTPTNNDKLTEFTSRPLNTDLITDSRITQIAENYFETYLVRQNKTKVSDSRSAMTASTVQSTETTLHYSLRPVRVSFTNNTTLSTDLGTKAKIPEEYFVTDHSTTQKTIPVEDLKSITQSENHNNTIKPFASEECKTSLSNAVTDEVTTKKYNKLPKESKEIEHDRVFYVSPLNNAVNQTEAITFTSESPEKQNISETKIPKFQKKTMEPKYQNIATKTTLESLTTLSTLNFTKLHHQSIHDDTEGINVIDRVTSVELMSTIASHVTAEEPYERTVQKIRTNVTINGITKISPIETTISQSTQVNNDTHSDVSDDFIGKAKPYYNYTNAGTENNKKRYVTTEENKVTAQDTLSTMRSIDIITSKVEPEMTVGFNKKVPKNKMTTFQNIFPSKNVASTESIKLSTYSPNPLTNTDILNKQSNQSTQFFRTTISTEPHTETEREAYTTKTSTSHSESIRFSEFNTTIEDFQSTEGSGNFISESEYKQTASDTTVTRFVDNEYGMENYTEMPEIQQSANTNTLSECLVSKTNESNFTSEPLNINEKNDLEITSILKGNKNETSDILNITSEIPLTYYESETEVTQVLDSTLKITTIPDMQKISDEPTKNRLKVPNNDLKALPRDESVVNKLLDKDVRLHIYTSPEKTFTLKKNISLNINTNTDSFHKVYNNVSKTLSSQNVSSTVESPLSHGSTSTEITPSELREFTSEHITINANISADDLLAKHKTTFADIELNTTPKSGMKRSTTNRTDNTFINALHSSNYFTTELSKTVSKEVTTMGMIAQNKNQIVEYLTISTMAMSSLKSINHAILKTKNTKKITVPTTKKKHHENLTAIANDIVIEKIMPPFLTPTETTTRNELHHDEMYYFRNNNGKNLTQGQIGNTSSTDNIQINDVKEATNSLYTEIDLHEYIQDELMPDLKATPTVTATHKTFNANNWSSPLKLTYSENKEDIITTVLGPEFIELTNNSDVEEFKESTLFTPETVFSALRVSMPVTLNSTDVMQNTRTNKQLPISDMNTKQTQSFLQPYMETPQYSFIETFQTSQADARNNATTRPIFGSNEVTITEDFGELSTTSQVTDFVSKPFNKSGQLFEKETESSIDTTTSELVKMQLHFDESNVTPAYVITKSIINGTNVNVSTESSLYKPHRMQTTFANKTFTYYVTESSTLTKANKNYTENLNAKRPKSSKRNIKLKSPIAFELNIRVGVETNKDGIKFSVLDEKETVYSKSELRLPITTYFNSNRSGNNNIIETLSKSEKKFVNETKINKTASLNDNITNALLTNMNTNRRSNYVTKEDLSRIAAIMEKMKNKTPVVKTKFPQRTNTQKTFVRNTTMNEEIQPHQVNTTSCNASSTSMHSNFTNIKYKSKMPGSLTEESPAIKHIQSIYKEHIEKIQESINNTKNGNISATDVLKKFYQAIITLPVAGNINNSRLNISGFNSTSHKNKTQKDLQAGVAGFSRGKTNLGKSEPILNKNNTNTTSTLIKKKIDKLLIKKLKGKNLSKSQMQKLKRKLFENLTSKKNVPNLHKVHDTVKKKYYDIITDSDKLTTTTPQLPLCYNSTTIKVGNATRIRKVETSSSSSLIIQTPNKKNMSFENNKKQSNEKMAEGINKHISAEIIFNTTGKYISEGARRLFSHQIELESSKLKPETLYQYTSTETNIGFNKYVTAITPLTTEKRFSGIILSRMNEDLSKPENESNKNTNETSNDVILNSIDVLTKTEVTKETQSIFDELNYFIEEVNGISSQKKDNITSSYVDVNSTAKITNKGRSNYNMSTIVTDAGNRTAVTNIKIKTAATKYGIMTAPLQTTVAIHATDKPLLITKFENTLPNKFISDNEYSKHTVAMNTVKLNISGKSEFQSDDNAAAVTFPLTSSISIMDSSTTDYTSTSTPNYDQLKPTPYMFFGLSLLPEVQSLSNTKNVSAEYNFATTANIFEHKADSDESTGTLIKEMYKRKQNGKKNVSKKTTNQVKDHFEITKTSTATYPSNISINIKEEIITTEDPIEEYFNNTADEERDNRHMTLNMEEKKTTKIPAVTQPPFIQMPTTILSTEKKLEGNDLKNEIKIINASNLNKTTTTKNTEEQHLSTNTPNLTEKKIENLNEPKKAYLQTSQNISKKYLEKIFGDDNYISTVTVMLPTTNVTNVITSEITLPPLLSKALNIPLTETMNLPITTHIPVEDDSIDRDAFIISTIERQNASKTEPTFVVIDRYTNPTDIKVNSNGKDNTNLIKLKVHIVKNETYINLHNDIRNNSYSSLQKKEDNVIHENENKNAKRLAIDRHKSSSVNTSAATVTILTFKDYEITTKIYQSNEIFVENFTQPSNLVYDETMLPLPKGVIYKKVVGTTRSNIMQDSTDLPLVSNFVNTSAMIPKINQLDPYTSQIVANQCIENKNVNYQTFADNVTENNNIFCKNIPIATQDTIAVTDSMNQVTKVSSDASTHGDNTSLSEIRKYDKILDATINNANKTQLLYLVDKSVNVSGTNIRNIINTSKNNACDQRDPLVSIKQNRSKKLQDETSRQSKSKPIILNVHDGEKNISVIRTPTLTHVKVTKMNPVNKTTVNLKTEIQKLLLISRTDRTYQNGTMGKGFRSNSKSLLPIESRDFEHKKTIEIFSSRLNRPYSSFTTATAGTKNIRYNTYRPISKEELELLKYYNEHVPNTALVKQVSEKPHPPVPGLNYSSNARRSGVSSLQSESKPILQAANYSETGQMILAENQDHGDKGLHLALERKKNVNQPIEMIQIPHSAEIDRISHPILEININSPQIRTNGDSPPMIEINGNPLPIEINRNSAPIEFNKNPVPMDNNRNQLPTGINRNSVPMEINRYSMPMDKNRNPVTMDINRNSLPMDVNRYPVPFDINRNSVTIDDNRNPVLLDMNRNSAPMDTNRSPVQLDMNRNSAPMDMNRNSVLMDMNRNSEPLDMNQNSAPMDINRTSAPMDMNRNSAPKDVNRNPMLLDINRNLAPMNMNRNSAPIDMNRNLVPMDINRYSAPMDMNRNLMPMKMNRNSAPMDMNRNLVPMDVNRYSALVDMNRNLVPMDVNKNPMPRHMNRHSAPMYVNRNPVPLDMNRNSVPMDMNRNPVPKDINRNSAATDMNRNPVPMDINRNLAPMDMNRNPVPMDINRNSAPIDMNRNSAPTDMKRNPVPMDVNRNLAPMDMNRNSAPIENNRNSVTMDINRNPVAINLNRDSVPIEMTRYPISQKNNRSYIPEETNRNSVPMEINRDSPRTFEINKNIPPTLNLNRNSPSVINPPSIIDKNKNSHKIPDNNNRNPPAVIDINRYSLVVNKNSASVVHNKWNFLSIIGNNYKNSPSIPDNNEKSSIGTDDRRNGPSMTDRNKNSRSMDANMKTNKKSAPRNDYNQSNNSTIKTKIISARNMTGIKQPKAIVAAQKKILSMKEIKRKPLLTFGNNKKPLSIIGKNRKTLGALEINRNKHSKIVTKNFKQIGAQKEILLDSFEKRNPYTVKIKEPKSQKPGMKQMKIGTGRKALMTMNTQEFLSQRRYVTPRSVVQKNTKPYQRSVRKSILRPRFDNIKAAKRVEHKLKPKPVFINNEIFQTNSMSHRLTNKIHQKVRSEQNNQPMRMMAKKAKVSKKEIEDPMSYMFTVDYMKMTRRPAFNDGLSDGKGSNIFKNNYSPSPSYRRSFMEKSSTETGRTPRRGRTIFFLSPTVAYDQYN